MKSHAIAVDLFCGAGGLSLGLVDAGFVVAGAMDSWERAVANYKLNFSHPVLCEDIQKISGKEFLRQVGHDSEVHLVAGGPPCQGFSVQRIGEDADIRNSLVLEFGRFVSQIRPKMFLMENVPGLLGKRGKHVTVEFETLVKSVGYEVRSLTVNAAEYGVPQIRKRIFYYGWLQSEGPTFIFPPPTHSPEQFESVIKTIGDLPSPTEEKTRDQMDALHRRTRLSPLNLERLRYIPPGGGFENLPVNLRAKCHQNGAAGIGHRYVYGRLEPDRPAATITARFDSFTRGKFAHPFEDRNITLREGARLQTFPDCFHFEGSQEEIAALIGNAVPPLLAGVLGRAFFSHLSGLSEDVMTAPRQESQFQLFRA